MMMKRERKGIIKIDNEMMHLLLIFIITIY